MLSAATLARLRTTQEAALPDTCTIVRTTRSASTTSDDGTATPSTTTGVACRLMPGGNPREYEVGSRLTGATLWTLTLAHDADIRADDTVTIGTKTLYVVGVHAGQAWITATRALCEER